MLIVTYRCPPFPDFTFKANKLSYAFKMSLCHEDSLSILHIVDYGSLRFFQQAGTVYNSFSPAIKEADGEDSFEQRSFLTG